MTKKQIVKLSTRWLGPLKIVFYAVYFLVVVSLMAYLITGKSYLSALGNLIGFSYALFLLVKMTSKLQQVSFDDAFLYVKDKRQDLIIPLENIESVEVETLGGTYKVNLYHAEQYGKEFYFKCSLLYPLNYKSKDATVNLLRKYIDIAKRKNQELPHRALQS